MYEFLDFPLHDSLCNADSKGAREHVVKQSITEVCFFPLAMQRLNPPQVFGLPKITQRFKNDLRCLAQKVWWCGRHRVAREVYIISFESAWIQILGEQWFLCILSQWLYIVNWIRQRLQFDWENSVNLIRTKIKFCRKITHYCIAVYNWILKYWIAFDWHELVCTKAEFDQPGGEWIYWGVKRGNMGNVCMIVGKAGASVNVHKGRWGTLRFHSKQQRTPCLYLNLLKHAHNHTHRNPVKAEHIECN